MFVVWNGTNHFDSVESVSIARGDAIMKKAARPKATCGPRCPGAPKALTPKTVVATLPPALLHAAASAAHAASSAQRDAGEPHQHAARRLRCSLPIHRRCFGPCIPLLPCFMCSRPTVGNRVFRSAREARGARRPYGARAARV